VRETRFLRREEKEESVEGDGAFWWAAMAIWLAAEGCAIGERRGKTIFFFFFFKKRKRKKGYYVRIAVSQRIYLTQGWPLQTFFFLFLFGFLFLLMGFLRCCPIKR
jgi:hypothetical protein